DFHLAGGGRDRTHYGFTILETHVQWLVRLEVLHGRPIDRDLARVFRLENQGLVVRFLDRAGQTVTILENDLIGKKKRATKDERRGQQLSKIEQGFLQ